MSSRHTLDPNETIASPAGAAHFSDYRAVLQLHPGRRATAHHPGRREPADRRAGRSPGL
ncbi:hypothetical protein EMIT0194P_50251 [Pseudomonas serbica]